MIAPAKPLGVRPRTANVLLVHWKRWMIPGAGVALAGLVYALLAPVHWEASQALTLRNEASTAQNSPGKFGSPDEIKNVLETASELLTSRSVLEAALSQAGPAGHASASSWPTAQDIDDLRDRVKLVPPKGAEFGKTEVFYLKVRDPRDRRAMALTAAVCRQLTDHFQRLRDAKAQSMIAELTRAVAVARADLQDSSVRLTTVESRAGSDLAELRALSEPNSSESSLRRTLGELSAELRTAQSTQQANRELLGLLKDAQTDPGRLLATPNRLLESQPSLRRLKEGLVDAQLNTARSQGRMVLGHPLVQAAKESEEEISKHLHDELALALRGLEVEIRLGAERITLLESQLASLNERLSKLAGVRTTYAALVAECRSREALVQHAEQNLAEARAAEVSARSVSLINPLGPPDVGTRPVGLSRSMMALTAVLAGVLLGLGILALSPPPPARAQFATSSYIGGSHHTRTAPRSVLSIKEALRRVANGA